MSRYAATSTRALAQIRKYGAPVTFEGGTAPVHDPATGTFSGGTTVDVPGRAVEDEGDPDRYAALGLVMVNPVTLLVAAKGLGIRPVPGTKFTWAGLGYVSRDVNAISPDGVPIVYDLVGST